ncbi:MAG: S8 family serine peptidase [Propionibacteriaceae bacterium]|jgi:hypothetical protein|nr:S8 family serine peptidase [Propionibacteriaceae bacterium]
MKHQTTIRLAGGLSAVMALCLGAVGVTPTAHADGVITSQEYVDVTGLADLKAQGLDGSGVTIGIIDSRIDTTVPELQGADITVIDLCPEAPAVPGEADHATAVVSILANADWGWAPKASYRVYTLPDGSVEAPESCLAEGSAYSTNDTGYALNLALNDRVDIISMSLSGTDSAIQDYAIARAALTNVPVVAAAGNVGASGINIQLGRITQTAASNGVIAVGANSLTTGVRAEYSEYGAGLTVMAPGDPIAVRVADADGNLTVIDPAAGGTSFAAPMVAGALALAMQAWPDATGNQLVASLIATARGSGEWNENEGYGNFSPRALVANDPSGYSTDNPLLDKSPEGLPSAQWIADYKDGLVDPVLLPGDDDYVYCGTEYVILASMRADRRAPGRTPCNAINGQPPQGDPLNVPGVVTPTWNPDPMLAYLDPTESATPAVQPSAAATPAPEPEPASGPPAWLLAAGAAVIVLIGVSVTLLVRRRRANAPKGVAEGIVQ